MSKSLNAMYIINETSLVPETKMRILKEADDGIDKKGMDRVHIETGLIDADWLNRNRRIYEQKTLFPALNDDRLTELINTKGLYGEVAHPDDPSLARQAKVIQDRASHAIVKTWTQGKQVMGIVRASYMPVGTAFHNEIVYGGLIPAFSMRALGGLEQTSKGACVRDLKIITWDWVVFPSHKTAYMTKILGGTPSESKSLKESCELILLQEAAVKEFITSESKEVKLITNLLEYAFPIQTVSKDGKYMTIANDDEKIVIRLEDYVTKQIYDSLI
jgi:hypothetical protein